MALIYDEEPQAPAAPSSGLLEYDPVPDPSPASAPAEPGPTPSVSSRLLDYDEPSTAPPVEDAPPIGARAGARYADQAPTEPTDSGLVYDEPVGDAPLGASARASREALEPRGFERVSRGLQDSYNDALLQGAQFGDEVRAGRMNPIEGAGRALAAGAGEGLAAGVNTVLNFGQATGETGSRAIGAVTDLGGDVPNRPGFLADPAFDAAVAPASLARRAQQEGLGGVANRIQQAWNSEEARRAEEGRPISTFLDIPGSIQTTIPRGIPLVGGAEFNAPVGDVPDYAAMMVMDPTNYVGTGLFRQAPGAIGRGLNFLDDMADAPYRAARALAAGETAGSVALLGGMGLLAADQMGQRFTDAQGNPVLPSPTRWATERLPAEWQNTVGIAIPVLAGAGLALAFRGANKGAGLALPRTVINATGREIVMVGSDGRVRDAGSMYTVNDEGKVVTRAGTAPPSNVRQASPGEIIEIPRTIDAPTRTSAGNLVTNASAQLWDNLTFATASNPEIRIASIADLIETVRDNPRATPQQLADTVNAVIARSPEGRAGNAAATPEMFSDPATMRALGVWARAADGLIAMGPEGRGTLRDNLNALMSWRGMDESQLGEAWQRTVANQVQRDLGIRDPGWANPLRRYASLLDELKANPAAKDALEKAGINRNLLEFGTKESTELLSGLQNGKYGESRRIAEKLIRDMQAAANRVQPDERGMRPRLPAALDDRLVGANINWMMDLMAGSKAILSPFFLLSSPRYSVNNLGSDGIASIIAAGWRYFAFLNKGYADQQLAIRDQTYSKWSAGDVRTDMIGKQQPNELLPAQRGPIRLAFDELGQYPGFRELGKVIYSPVWAATKVGEAFQKLPLMNESARRQALEATRKVARWDEAFLSSMADVYKARGLDDKAAAKAARQMHAMVLEKRSVGHWSDPADFGFVPEPLRNEVRDIARKAKDSAEFLAKVDALVDQRYANVERVVASMPERRAREIIALLEPGLGRKSPEWDALWTDFERIWNERERPGPLALPMERGFTLDETPRTSQPVTRIRTGEVGMTPNVVSPDQPRLPAPESVPPRTEPRTETAPEPVPTRTEPLSPRDAYLRQLVDAARQANLPKDVAEIRLALDDAFYTTNLKPAGISEAEFYGNIRITFGDDTPDGGALTMADRRPDFKDDRIVRGYNQLGEDGIIYEVLTREANVSTVLHEGFHSYQRYMEAFPEQFGEPMRVLRETYGDDWEAQARGYERWVREGNAPTPALDAVFAKIRDWMVAIYERITGTAIDVKLTNEAREAFQMLFGGPRFTDDVRLRGNFTAEGIQQARWRSVGGTLNRLQGLPETRPEGVDSVARAVADRIRRELGFDRMKVLRGLDLENTARLNDAYRAAQSRGDDAAMRTIATAVNAYGLLVDQYDVLPLPYPETTRTSGANKGQTLPNRQGERPTVVVRRGDGERLEGILKDTGINAYAKAAQEADVWRQVYNEARATAITQVRNNSPLDVVSIERAFEPEPYRPLPDDFTLPGPEGRIPNAPEGRMATPRSRGERATGATRGTPEGMAAEPAAPRLEPGQPMLTSQGRGVFVEVRTHSTIGDPLSEPIYGVRLAKTGVVEWFRGSEVRRAGRTITLDEIPTPDPKEVKLGEAITTRTRRATLRDADFWADRKLSAAEAKAKVVAEWRERERARLQAQADTEANAPTRSDAAQEKAGLAEAAPARAGSPALEGSAREPTVPSRSVPEPVSYDDVVLPDPVVREVTLKGPDGVEYRLGLNAEMAAQWDAARTVAAKRELVGLVERVSGRSAEARLVGERGEVIVPGQTGSQVGVREARDLAYQNPRDPSVVSGAARGRDIQRQTQSAVGALGFFPDPSTYPTDFELTSGSNVRLDVSPGVTVLSPTDGRFTNVSRVWFQGEPRTGDPTPFMGRLEQADWYRDPKADPDLQRFMASASPLVLNPDGSPKRWYHGTIKGSDQFTRFDMNRANVDSLYGPGHYFTENPSIASSYAIDKGVADRDSVGVPDEVADRLLTEAAKYPESAAESLSQWLFDRWSATEPDSARFILLSSSPERYAAGLARVFKEGFNDFLSTTQDPFWPTMDELFQWAGTKYEQATGPTSLPVFLSVRNPFDIDARVDLPAFERLMVARGMPDSVIDSVMTEAQAGRGLTTNHDLYESILRVNEGDKAAVNDFLVALGFDGITHIGGGRWGNPTRGDARHRVMIALSDNQIKSATGNRGTFDPTNPDIRYQADPRPAINAVSTALAPALLNLQARLLAVADSVNRLPSPFREDVAAIAPAVRLLVDNPAASMDDVAGAMPAIQPTMREQARGTKPMQRVFADQATFNKLKDVADQYRAYREAEEAFKRDRADALAQAGLPPDAFLRDSDEADVLRAIPDPHRPGWLLEDGTPYDEIREGKPHRTMTGWETPDGRPVRFTKGMEDWVGGAPDPVPFYQKFSANLKDRARKAVEDLEALPDNVIRLADRRAVREAQTTAHAYANRTGEADARRALFGYDDRSYGQYALDHWAPYSYWTISHIAQAARYLARRPGQYFTLMSMVRDWAEANEDQSEGNKFTVFLFRAPDGTEVRIRPYMLLPFATAGIGEILNGESSRGWARELMGIAGLNPHTPIDLAAQAATTAGAGGLTEWLTGPREDNRARTLTTQGQIVNRVIRAVFGDEIGTMLDPMAPVRQGIYGTTRFGLDDYYTGMELARRADLGEITVNEGRQAFLSMRDGRPNALWQSAAQASSGEQAAWSLLRYFGIPVSGISPIRQETDADARAFFGPAGGQPREDLRTTAARNAFLDERPGLQVRWAANDDADKLRRGIANDEVSEKYKRLQLELDERANRGEITGREWQAARRELSAQEAAEWSRVNAMPEGRNLGRGTSNPPYQPEDAAALKEFRARMRNYDENDPSKSTRDAQAYLATLSPAMREAVLAAYYQNESPVERYYRTVIQPQMDAYYAIPQYSRGTPEQQQRWERAYDAFNDAYRAAIARNGSTSGASAAAFQALAQQGLSRSDYEQARANRSTGRTDALKRPEFSELARWWGNSGTGTANATGATGATGSRTTPTPGGTSTRGSGTGSVGTGTAQGVQNYRAFFADNSDYRKLANSTDPVERAQSRLLLAQNFDALVASGWRPTGERPDVRRAEQEVERARIFATRPTESNAAVYNQWLAAGNAKKLNELNAALGIETRYPEYTPQQLAIVDQYMALPTGRPRSDFLAQNPQYKPAIDAYFARQGWSPGTTSGTVTAPRPTTTSAPFVPRSGGGGGGGGGGGSRPAQPGRPAQPQDEVGLFLANVPPDVIAAIRTGTANSPAIMSALRRRFPFGVPLGAPLETWLAVARQRLAAREGMAA